jgi:hypothetical protein
MLTYVREAKWEEDFLRERREGRPEVFFAMRKMFGALVPGPVDGADSPLIQATQTDASKQSCCAAADWTARERLPGPEDPSRNRAVITRSAASGGAGARAFFSPRRAGP